MLRKGKGHIVTVGSLTGLLGTYKCTDYSATKHATIGFHESLRTELKVIFDFVLTLDKIYNYVLFLVPQAR